MSKPQSPKRHQAAVLTVRRGHELIHVHDFDLAVEFMLGRSPCPSSPPANAKQDDLFDALAHGAASILDKLVAAFPLMGRASTSLPTALRVKQVRAALSSKEDILKTVEYISDGADAIRHLSPALVSKTIQELDDLLQLGDVDEKYDSTSEQDKMNEGKKANSTQASSTKKGHEKSFNKKDNNTAEHDKLNGDKKVNSVQANSTMALVEMMPSPPVNAGCQTDVSGLILSADEALAAAARIALVAKQECEIEFARRLEAHSADMMGKVSSAMAK